MKATETEVYMGIVRMKSEKASDRTWVQVRASKLKAVIAQFEEKCPSEVAHTLHFKLIPVTMHDNWGTWNREGEGTAYIGVNAYRSQTTAEFEEEAAKAKASHKDIIEDNGDWAEFQRLSRKFAKNLKSA